MARLEWNDAAWQTPAAISVAYLLFGAAWIVFSDWAVTQLFGLSALTALAQLSKGLLFVAGSGAFIYWLVARRDRSIERREARIRTDRSRIEELRSEVQESEQLLRTILGNIMETVLLTDDEGRFTYVCPNVSFIFAYSPEEVEEMGSIDALLGEEFPLDDLEGWDLIQNIEHEVVDADGQTHTVLVTVKSVEIESGSVLYSIRDVSERKAQEDRFKAYVENSSDVFTVIDREREVEYVSPSVERILGYEPGELIGRDPLELVHPEDRGELREVFEDVATAPTDTTVSVQYRTRHADGPWVWTESRLTAPGKEGVGEFVINTRDVSDLREREGRLSVLDRVLRHNIRNKLNIVLGASEDLKERLGAEERERLSLVEDATQDLLRLSEKARRFDTVIRAGHSTAEPTDLVEIARRVVAEKRLEYPDVEFRTHFPEEAWVSAHEAFELALGELVDNASLHSNQESPTIDVEIDADGGTTTITVADFGPGIPDMDRQAVLRGEETPLEHGMNIGLWLVRWTIDNSDGTLSVSENAPTGTRVEARLPSVDSTPAD
jgi:PAS domain S-box-containing protein